MNFRELAEVLQEKNEGLGLNVALEQAERMLSALDALPVESGTLFDTGARDKGEPRPKHGPAKRGRSRVKEERTPTNSVRMNRALVELSPMAYKIHSLLWRWRGAPAKGNLPFFTIHSLAKFCGTGRHEVKRVMAELTSKGWIQPGQYDCHKKNSLFRLVPIEEIPVPGVDVEASRDVVSPAPGIGRGRSVEKPPG